MSNIACLVLTKGLQELKNSFEGAKKIPPQMFLSAVRGWYREHPTVDPNKTDPTREELAEYLYNAGPYRRFLSNEDIQEVEATIAERAFWQQGSAVDKLTIQKFKQNLQETIKKQGYTPFIRKHSGFWSRQEAENNPRILYIFTDNTDRDSGTGTISPDSWYSKKYGKGHHYPTQTAAVIRGIDNARPISTQRWYHAGAKGPTGRWTDAAVEEFKRVIEEELSEIIAEFNTGKYDIIMFPNGGSLFNTHISNISKDRTPKLYQTLTELLRKYGFNTLVPKDTSNEQPQTSVEGQTFLPVKDPTVFTKIAIKPWRSNPQKSNTTLRIYLKNAEDRGYFEVVKDEEENYYSIHFKPVDKNNPNAWTKEEKAILFQAAATAIPQGAYLSTWGNISKGGIAGLNRFKNLGFTEISQREIKDKEDRSVIIPILQKITSPSETQPETVEEKQNKETELPQVQEEQPFQHNLSATMDTMAMAARVRTINRFFMEEVDGIIEEEVERLKGELEKAETFDEKYRIAKKIKNMRPFVAIKQAGPFAVYDRVREMIEDYIAVVESDKEAYIKTEKERLAKFKTYAKLDPVKREKLLTITSKNSIETRLKTYKEILDNWREYIEEAAASYGNDWGVLIDLKENNIKEDDTQQEEAENKEEEVAEEENLKEGYQVKVRELSAFETASQKVKLAIAKMARIDPNSNDVARDFLGNPEYLSQSYVFAELITGLKTMVSPTEMLPLLEQLASKRPWVNQMVDALKKDDQLFTAFYTVFRKDYLNLWVAFATPNKKGGVTIKVKKTNRGSGLQHYFDEWRDNVEYGNVLHVDSIYDKEGHMKKDKITEAFNIIDPIAGEIVNMDTPEEKQNAILTDINTIRDTLLKIGINITSETLEELLTRGVDLEDNLKQLPGVALVSNLANLLTYLNKDEKVVDNEPFDLLNNYGRVFSKIAFAINRVDKDEVESSARIGKKTLYAHTRPSYFTTTIKRLKSTNAVDYINNEYSAVDFFYDKKQGRWLNHLLEDLVDSSEERDLLEHAVLYQYQGKEYKDWTPLDTFLALYNMFNTEPWLGKENRHAYYASPVLSDKQSAEFIKAKRRQKDEILDLFVDVVRQEYNRIVTVLQRSETDCKKIPCYDMSNKSAGGAQFHFFPELNTAEYGEAGKSFYDRLREVADNTDEFNRIAREAVADIMEKGFTEACREWQDIGVFERLEEGKNTFFKYFDTKDPNQVRNRLEEFYYNHSYMQSQIIQLLGSDLAFYKNYPDFVKRSSAFHGPTDKLNTLAKWNGEYVLASKDDEGNITVRPERVITLKDDVKPSNHMKEVEEIIDQRVKAGELTAADKAVILDKWKRTNATDAQGIRTLPSFRAVLIASDQWSDEAETAYNNIRNGQWTARDFIELWNTIKPFSFSNVNADDAVGGTHRIPVLHKNSEVLALTESIFGDILSRSGKLKGLTEFMEKNDIDVAMFESAVKTGGQGIIDLNNATTEAQVKETLEKAVLKEGKINPEVVREIDWENYGIQVASKEHGVNHVVLVGSQIRRLIGADISPDAKITLDGKTLTREQWRAYFNAINTANIREAFEALDATFKDPKKISEILISEIRNNSRYNNDLIEAVTLDENGQFNIPIFDPNQSQKLQELLNSIIKSRVVKQKIAGGALVQATAWLLNDKDKPQIVWDTDENGNKRVKYIEAYLPCPNDKLYGLLVEEDGSININKKDENGNYIVPAKYRECIAYRIPTESKYSMIPVKIKGFLPRQVGSVIILPEEITDLTGSDFDFDKMYTMYHTLKVQEDYNFNEALKTFYAAHSQFVVRGKYRALEGKVKEVFQEWYDKYKEKFKYTKVTLDEFNEGDVDFESSTFKQDIYKQAKTNSKKQRDSKMIDLIHSVLTNSDIAPQIVNVGNFDEMKRSARIVTLFENLTSEDIRSLGGVKTILNLTLEEADEIGATYNKKFNPLSPATWITFQQRNMAGANLIGIAAIHNIGNALCQLTKNFGVKDDYSFIFNGKRLQSLKEVRNEQGKFVSRIVSECLAAFVDNAKDPVAGDLNISMATADLAFALLRLGNSALTTGLILKQPAMKKVLRYMATGKYNMDSAIDQCFKDYKTIREKGGVIGTGGVKDFNFTDEWLAGNIVAEKSSTNDNEKGYFADSQIKVLAMLTKMQEVATALGNITRSLRADSVTGNVGGNIANTTSIIDSIYDIIEASVAPDYPLTGTDFVVDYVASTEEDEIIDSPYATQIAFYRYSIEASMEWFKKLFPQVSNKFRAVTKAAKGLTQYGRLDKDAINRIHSHFIMYLISGKSQNFTGVQEARDFYINTFPLDFLAFKKDNSVLVSRVPLLQRLQVNFSNKYHTTPTITFSNVGTITNAQIAQYMSDFRYLMSNPRTQELARRLFIYCFHRGFSYRHNGFSNLIPSMMKMSNLTDYVPTLRSVLEDTATDPEEVWTFLYQYIRNNFSDRRFTPDVTNSGVVNTEFGMPESFQVEVTFDSPKELKQFAFPFRKKDIPRMKPFVCIMQGKTPYYYAYDETSKSYNLTTPLGNENYQEYEYGNTNPTTVVKKKIEKKYAVDPSTFEEEEGTVDTTPRDTTLRFRGEVTNTQATKAVEQITKPQGGVTLGFRMDIEDEERPRDAEAYEKLNEVTKTPKDKEGNKPCN